MLIISVSLLFFTIFYLTYFGMFFFLKNQTTTVQNVTVSSEGPIRQVLKNYISCNVGCQLLVLLCFSEAYLRAKGVGGPNFL